MNCKIKMTALLAALFCLLAGCKGDGDGEGANLPEEYSVGEEVFAALTIEDEGAQLRDDPAISYTYDGLASSGSTVADYVSQMTGEDSGFSVVDEELVKSAAPDFTAEEGTVCLAKNAEEEGMAVLLQLSWEEGSCTVTMEEVEGVVTEAPEVESMSLVEAVDYLYSLPPSALGLSGETMDRYHIYAQNGIVLVDGYPCLQLNIYDKGDSPETNEFAGSYMMTGDGLHLYRLDRATGTVEELD